VKPVNLEALSKWVGHLPSEVIEDVRTENFYGFIQLTYLTILFLFDPLCMTLSLSLSPQMGEIAPMLAHFGYDPNANPPVYGKPDSFVVKNTNDIIEHGVFLRFSPFFFTETWTSLFSNPN